MATFLDRTCHKAFTSPGPFSKVLLLTVTKKADTFGVKTKLCMHQSLDCTVRLKASQLISLHYLTSSIVS